MIEIESELSFYRDVFDALTVLHHYEGVDRVTIDLVWAVLKGMEKEVLDKRAALNVTDVD